MAAPPWYKGVVIKVEDENYNTKKFFIQIPEVEAFHFIPGQFVTLDLPIHDKPNKRWRSYSIASPPDGNVIELLIVVLEGAPALPTYLITSLLALNCN
jgi:CDP-4-dehydro-6-deoxyglucose reductase